MSDSDDDGAPIGGGGGETLDFGFQEEEKPIGGRRAKKLKEQKKKMKAGSFDTMGFAPDVLKAIKRKGYRLPTPIQRKAMPFIMQGLDVVGMARTGSGKTAAFVLPMIHRLKTHSLRAGARAIILAPTRELALQTHKTVRELAKFTDLRTACLVGGDALETQFAELATNPDIIVATPGRLAHHLEEVEGLSLRGVEYVVVDEADRMFEMGFIAQVTELLRSCSPGRQTLLFSATMPATLAEFASAGLNAPQLVRLDAERKISPELGMAFFTCRFEDKTAALLHLVREVVPAKQLTILFTATRHHAEFLYGLLLKEGADAACVFGSMDQTARKIHVAKFRAGRSHLLVTTDVAARGIDIPLIDNVINFDFPPKPELFVHRVGRAARAGRSGTAYNLLTRDELPYLLDLHLYLSRSVKPAPLIPEIPSGPLPAGADAASLTASTSAAAAAAAGRAPESVYGTLPAVVLDPLIEHVREVIQSSADLDGMGRTLNNAWGMYCKTRPQASAQSVRRARALSKEGVHPLLLQLLPRTRYTQIENEAALAQFTERLKTFRPAATVLEAEIARVKSTFANPLLLEGGSGAMGRNGKSTEVMAAKRAAHAHIVEKERQKRLRQAEEVSEAQARKRRRGPGGSEEGEDEDEAVAYNGGDESDDDDDGDGASSDGEEDDDEGAGGRGKKSRRAGGAAAAKAAAAAAAAYGDGVVSDGRYRDPSLYISHVRDGRQRDEAFEAETKAAELQAAVLDMTAEDAQGMSDAKRRYHWDKRSKKYVLRSSEDTQRKGRKLRNEAGKVVQLKEGEKGALYKKWSKTHHKRVAPAGDEEDGERGGGGLAGRFERRNLHQQGAPGRDGGGFGGRGFGGRGGGRGGARGGSRGGVRGGGRGGAPLGARNAGLKTEDQVRKERKVVERRKAWLQHKQEKGGGGGGGKEERGGGGGGGGGRPSRGGGGGRGGGSRGGGSRGGGSRGGGSRGGGGRGGGSRGGGSMGVRGGVSKGGRGGGGGRGGSRGGGRGGARGGSRGGRGGRR
ncbi:hypothetical protein HYH03_010307 [Edaphochlamys debaryana]|uniref:RNA helicase n=1 Tax=Edaphochlamys debaryana TaxID=47281 RepID=A0A835XZI8_9CHLO|nr:hypothetical protein HYH03_010307 [Edaphochlamys debaryana]|eukprot:KAG2491301.1 hypothetical protein HYH03_010307 [Edaphochlamys debaryana]